MSNEPLFFLGVTLVELLHGHRLEDMRIAEDVNASDEFVTTVQTVSRVLDSLASESGQRYADVVSHCIRCPYRTASTSFDSQEFQHAVIETVVLPLMQELKGFEGA